jgi:hypothetical protein
MRLPRLLVGDGHSRLSQDTNLVIFYFSGVGGLHRFAHKAKLLCLLCLHWTDHAEHVSTTLRF